MHLLCIRGKALLTKPRRAEAEKREHLRGPRETAGKQVCRYHCTSTQLETRMSMLGHTAGCQDSRVPGSLLTLL